MFSFKGSGSYSKTEKFLQQLQQGDFFSDLASYGRQGVDALAKATPTETGKTANSWGFNVVEKNGIHGIEWYNTNVHNGAQIAILLQYGHGTGTGGYVSGYDYINPAIRPIFDKIAEDYWRKVTSG